MHGHGRGHGYLGGKGIAEGEVVSRRRSRREEKVAVWVMGLCKLRCWLLLYKD